MKLFKPLLLPLILVLFSFLYMATSVDKSCTTLDCQQFSMIADEVRSGRDWVQQVNRCRGAADICVYVKDTTGINWDLFADTVCQIATAEGLLNQTVYVLAGNQTGVITHVVKQCP
ncbi:MAG: hypothetical protein J0M10_18565 [Chitinophagales bacterium]|nr:hypothetical protein [Chitinophagales bacterium]